MRISEEIARHFGILEYYCATYQGEHLLTLEIERERPNCSRDELTCYAYVIRGRGTARRPRFSKAGVIE